MGKATHRSRGFTLIASLLLLLLLSAIAVGLMYTVTGSGKVGSNDLEANTAYYGAESGMEKLTADLASLYQQKLNPTQTDLTNLAKTSPPSSAMVAGMTYLETASWNSVDSHGNPVSSTSVVSQGPFAGLTALIVPMTLQVSAIRPSGAAVNMTRGVEVALVPVFQFGVFSDSDLTYFAGPQFSFLGRVHTNGNLYLTSNPGPLVIGDRITVVGQILRDRLPDNYAASGSTYTGDVYLANASGGCNAFAAALKASSTAANPEPGSCVNFGPDTDNTTNDASWSGGIPTAHGVANTSPTLASTIYKSTFNSYAATGVAPLQMPFVQGTAVGSANSADTQIEIIRKQETTAELPTSPIGASREYNKANIHILLGDNCGELHPDGSACDNGGGGNDIELEQSPGYAVNKTAGTSYFAVADPTTTKDPNLIKPRCGPNTVLAPYPVPAEAGCTQSALATWPLVRGWLRVEYCNSADCNVRANWVGVTNEWLKYGFARDYYPPSRPVTVGGAGTNDVHPDAILIFQQLADRNGDNTISGSGTNTMVQTGGVNMGYENTSKTGLNYNFYPINFFDPREGFPRDTLPAGFASTNTQCYVNGIMNAVELDVGNLAQWLAGNGDFSGGSGKNVNSGPQNGYLVYFSDRRGEMPDPNATPTPNVTNGESGLEDVINSSDPANGVPDGNLEPITAGYNGSNGFSPEDVDENQALDNWGAANIGDGFNLKTYLPASAPNPYQAVDCLNGGRQNWVSGARHVLRLVDGGMSAGGVTYLPLPGFSVASENPLYILGDYNSNSADTVWTTGVDETQSAAGVMADAVTVLSNNWSDLVSMKNPNNLGGRVASQTSYRVAVAAGKNMDFPNFTSEVDFGTDGGVHNFLRYIESWGSGVALNYRGSLVSMYYSEYATGLFKCCTTVYSPPQRNYSFDQDFLTPTKLPPGTPLLQDIDTLSYWQNFNPCTTQTGTTCTN
jgi:type IV pilus assembly PilX-like protein